MHYCFFKRKLAQAHNYGIANKPTPFVTANLLLEEEGIEAQNSQTQSLSPILSNTKRCFVLLEHSIGHISKGVGWLPMDLHDFFSLTATGRQCFFTKNKKKSMFTLFDIFREDCNYDKEKVPHSIPFSLGLCLLSPQTN